MLAATYFADINVNHGSYLWGFSFISLVLVFSIGLGVFYWFYVFLAAFFLLGCWFKIIIHHIFEYPYIEPTGNFSGMDGEWINYYVFASVVVAALVLAKTLFFLIELVASSREKLYLFARPVGRSDWAWLIFFASLYYFANNIFGFFVTGVNAKLILPFGLNAPFAFMSLIGVAIIVSMFISRDIVARREIKLIAMTSVLLITSIASMSMASRAAVVMQSIPMLLAATYLQKKIGGKNGVSLKPYYFFAILLITVLIVVTLYRIKVFSGGSSSDTELLLLLFIESSMLAIDRWIGAEAIMVAISEPSASVDLFFRLLSESPTQGVGAIYQNIAGSRYEFQHGLTFLTLPGYIGILGLSGSMWIVFFGVFLVAFSGIIYEKFIRWAMLSQVICVALISAAVANAITQLSFPALFLPFIFQLTFFSIVCRFFLREKFFRKFYIFK